MQRTKIDLIERFWSKVQKSSGCWIWKDGTFDNGYGQFRVLNKKVKAHRFSWEITYGPIPDGLKVLHKCDNPPCVNPNHLFLGTNKDNTWDSIKKGRFCIDPNRFDHPCGEDHPLSVLTNEKVLEIRFLHKNGRSKYSLAKQFNVVQDTITKVVNGITWRHLLCSEQK
jgi:hypothetical protein